MATITITITTGNEAMQDGIDAARALDKISAQLEETYAGQLAARVGLSKPILDLNGNTVGTWQVSE